MPNWCENDLIVRGPVVEVRLFQEIVKADKAEGNEQAASALSADKIIPYPEDYRILDEVYDTQGRGMNLPPEKQLDLKNKGFDLAKDGFNQGGIEWCSEHWGTKWGFCHVEVRHEHEGNGELEVEYGFDTAWAPPIPLIKRMGELFPALEFELRYFESGMCFNGCLRINGDSPMEASGVYFGDRGG